MSDDLRYPVGRFQKPDRLGDAMRDDFIDEIATLPRNLRAAVEGLTADQLETPYRPDGWTVRQLVHHLPDSHVNAYVRLKLALTEDEPTIKTYEEHLWAELDDSRTTPIATSLALLEALHDRWVHVWRSMAPADFQRKLRHPDAGPLTMDQALALYAWHGRHHVAHVTSLRRRNGW
jgi:hypothetical protein